MTGVLLCNLHLQHLIGLPEASHQRVNRLTDLEVHRTVLDLKNHVVVIIAVHCLEVVIAGSCAVRLIIAPVLRAVVDKASPDDGSAVGLHQICQHVGAVGLRSSVGERARTSLRIRLYQEAAEIRNPVKHLCDLLLPPCDDLFIQRIAVVQTADFNRRSEVQAQIQADSVCRKDLRHCCHLVKITIGNEVRRITLYVDVVDDNGVDANARDKARIIPGSFIHKDRAVPEEEGISGISALNVVGHIVPVIQHAERIGRNCRLFCFLRRFSGSDGAKQSKNAVKSALFSCCLDPDFLRCHLNAIALRLLVVGESFSIYKIIAGIKGKSPDNPDAGSLCLFYKNRLLSQHAGKSPGQLFPCAANHAGLFKALQNNPLRVRCKSFVCDRMILQPQLFPFAHVNAPPY